MKIVTQEPKRDIIYYVLPLFIAAHINLLTPNYSRINIQHLYTVPTKTTLARFTTAIIWCDMKNSTPIYHYATGVCGTTINLRDTSYVAQAQGKWRPSWHLRPYFECQNRPFSILSPLLESSHFQLWRGLSFVFLPYVQRGYCICCVMNRCAITGCNKILTYA